MEDEWGQLARGFVMGGALAWIAFAYMGSDAPCVYFHGWSVDSMFGAASKRTCRAMFDEGNSRIESQRDQIKKLNDQVEELTAQLEARGQAPVVTYTPAPQIEPLEEKVNRGNDDDDDDD